MENIYIHYFFLYIAILIALFSVMKQLYNFKIMIMFDSVSWGERMISLFIYSTQTMLSFQVKIHSFKHSIQNKRIKPGWFYQM